MRLYWPVSAGDDTVGVVARARDEEADRRPPASVPLCEP